MLINCWQKLQADTQLNTRHGTRRGMLTMHMQGNTQCNPVHKNANVIDQLCDHIEYSFLLVTRVQARDSLAKSYKQHQTGWSLD